MSCAHVTAAVAFALAALVSACGDGSGDGGDIGDGPGGGFIGAPAEPSCSGADLSGLAGRVYVSTKGTDGSGCGTTTGHACQTIQQGIDSCSGAGCGVLVRHGLYRTQATLALKDGVSVYGGCLFDGETGHRYRTVIDASPGAATPAISGHAIDSPTTVHGLVVIREDVVAGGGASIAMTVTSSQGLTLERSVLVSGRGGDGNAGPGSAPAAPGGPGVFGNNVQLAAGASGGQTCPSSPPPLPSGIGGQGGDGLQGYTPICFVTCYCKYSNPDQSLGRAGQSSGSVPGGAGGSQHSWGGDWCTDPASADQFAGQSGNRGNAGACSSTGGVASASLWGSLTAAGWSAGTGGTGAPGAVGSGGGGGTSGGVCVGFTDGIHSEFVQGVPGGGGGGGGCGGSGGAGGEQGGASIALSLYASNVTLPSGDVVLAAGAGGRGGAGGAGIAGGPGGTGGTGSSGQFTTVHRYNCPGPAGTGGPGGEGGAGAGGAGGNGGPSINLALAGGSALPANASFSNAGAAGPGGGTGGGGVNPDCTAAPGAGGIGSGSAKIVDFDHPPSSVHGPDAP